LGAIYRWVFNRFAAFAFPVISWLAIAISLVDIPSTGSNSHSKSKGLVMINSEKLNAVLQNFVSGTGEVQGAAIVTPDGLPLATTLPGGMDEERVAAMSAAMLSLGERIGNELVRGLIDRIFVQGEKGFGILTSCGEDAVLLVLASEAAKQGLLMLEIKRAAAELMVLLS
jgi:predicted regulator of Ras-like GTPase activity (Roadblock/LC7/MglB family)